MYEASKIPIIYYHSVAPSPNANWYKNYLTFKLEYFESILKFLKKNNYNFLFLSEYFEIARSHRRTPERNILLTFDDGFLDNFVYVYPLLKKYKIKATIFISPEFVQNEETNLRTTLEEVWDGQKELSELESLGYLSWAEIKEMEGSGIVDIQSHTLTHTKYYNSNVITQFHNPDSNYLYPIANLYPERKPYYITDPSFRELIPYGTPFFKESSSVITRIVSINDDFISECVDLLKDSDWRRCSYQDAFEKVAKVYNFYIERELLIKDFESQKEYELRISKELKESKRILESKLGKIIEHCCWPHGDYNEFCHETAISLGYQSTSFVVQPGQNNKSEDRFCRTGSGTVMDSRLLTLLKTKYKIASYMGVIPHRWISNLYNRVIYGV